MIEFTNAARETYGTPDLLQWAIMFYGCWLMKKLVGIYNDSGFGDF